jgi:hypothetical protein
MGGVKGTDGFRVSGFGRIAESKRGLKDDIEMVA